MNVQDQTVRDLAVAKYDEIFAKAKGEKMKARVKAVNEACSVIVDNNGIPNARNVMEWIVTKRPGAYLPEQTIYNKRKGEISPYLEIIQVWAAFAASKSLLKSPVGTGVQKKGLRFELVTNEDLISIGDIVVRHKVALLKGQFEALRNQTDIRKAIKDNPPVAGFLTVGTNKDAENHNMALTEGEIEALTDFLNKNSAVRYSIEFDNVGAVVAKRPQPGARLTKPGFVDAIRKIVASYGSQMLE